MEIASKRPRLTAGLLLLFAFSMEEGCRCQRARQATGGDAGKAPAATARLAGAVVDRRDRPVPEARVLALSLSGDGGAPAPAAPFETATNLEGHFVLPPLPPGSYRLLIEA